MRFPRRPRALAGLLIFLATAGGAGAGEPVDFLRLPPGFHAEILVPDVPNARSMALSPDGTLFVGTRRGGTVYAVRGALGGKPQVLKLAENLKIPNGVAFRDGALYVAEPERILRYPDVERRLGTAVEPEVVVALPYKNAAHAWKYIAFGPDGKLYVPFGAPCNVCDVEADFATIQRMNPDGSDREVYATGVRNTVGFTWHPQTGELWFTDNGRDMLGDELPACELNRAPKAGLDFGFPYCHGNAVSDPEYATGVAVQATAPVRELGRTSPAGCEVLHGTQFRRSIGQVLIAEHGSWNRSKEAGKTGFRLTLVKLRGNQALSYEPS